MINIFLYYTAMTILLAFIDTRRRIDAMSPTKKNISHGISSILGVIAGIIGWWVLDAPKPFFLHQWWVWNFYYVPLCLGIRIAFFDVAYNLFRRNPPFTESKTTSSITDKEQRQFHITPLEQMLIGLGMIIVCLVIYYV